MHLVLEHVMYDVQLKMSILLSLNQFHSLAFCGAYFFRKEEITMTLIELGSLAGAMVAVITLTTKIISLITSIQNLINRLDVMQRDLEYNKSKISEVTKQVNTHESKIFIIETKLNDIQKILKEKLNDVFK